MAKNPTETGDFNDIQGEVYNHHDKPIVFHNRKFPVHLQPFAELRIVIEPKSHGLIPHQYFDCVFEDGSPVGPLHQNFGRAKGKGIKSPSQYNHAEHSPKAVT